MSERAQYRLVLRQFCQRETEIELVTNNWQYEQGMAFALHEIPTGPQAFRMISEESAESVLSKIDPHKPAWNRGYYCNIPVRWRTILENTFVYLQPCVTCRQGLEEARVATRRDLDSFFSPQECFRCWNCMVFCRYRVLFPYLI